MALYNKKGKVSFYSAREVDEIKGELAREARKEIRRAQRIGSEALEEANKEAQKAIRKARRDSREISREAQESVEEANREVQRSFRDARKTLVTYVEFDAIRAKFERQPYVQVHSLLGKIEKMKKIDEEIRKKFPRGWKIRDVDLGELEKRCDYYIEELSR